MLWMVASALQIAISTQTPHRTHTLPSLLFGAACVPVWPKRGGNPVWVAVLDKGDGFT